MHAPEQHAIIAGLPTLVPAGAAAPPQQPPLPQPPQVEGLAAEAAAAAAAAVVQDPAFEGFEGPEKTLEIDLLRGAGGEADADGRCGLRRIPREQWNELLDLAACKILSTVSNEHIDSYVLSESSLFVLSHKVMLKTCGTTTLLRIVPPLLAAIARLGMKVEWFNYSRKNFTYPHKQLSPHQSFDAEIAYLSTHFPGGEAFMLGPLNADHWYVYDWSSDESAAPGALEQSKDVVLDLMMFDMDPAVAAIFYKGKEAGAPAAAAVGAAADGAGGGGQQAAGGAPAEEGADAAPADAAALATAGEATQQQQAAADLVASREVAQRSGIASIFPGALLDGALFDPCGYSVNGLLFDSYFTIHVTPEPQCSYASFETTTCLRSYSSLIKNVLQVFKPKRLVMTLFTDDGAKKVIKEHPFLARTLDVPKIGQFKMKGHSTSRFEAGHTCEMCNWVLDESGEPETSPERRVRKQTMD